MREYRNIVIRISDVSLWWPYCWKCMHTKECAARCCTQLSVIFTDGVVILEIWSSSLHRKIARALAVKRIPQNLTNDKSTLFPVMAWRWPTSILPYVITRPQWVNSLWPNDAIWWQISRSTLVQVMACCLTAPSHYLNQWWLITSVVERHSSKASSQEITQPSITEIIWKIKYLKFHSNFPGANELKMIKPCVYL